MTSERLPSDRWLMPEGVEEILAPASWRMEALRRRVLDHYRERNYELVVPPLIEYLDSLLTGAGGDLDLLTFKLTDQLNGRMMGLRADITPQTARIDARRYADSDQPNRLCYLGTVLRTRPEGLGGPRCLSQLGAELFGQSGSEADHEIITLMIETLALCGIESPHIDLGHAAIYAGLVREADLADEDERRLFDCLQRKSRPDLELWLANNSLSDTLASALLALLELNGDVSIIDRARAELGGITPCIALALDELAGAADMLEKKHAGVTAHFDLAELKGYRYQTGLVFSAFVPGHARELARGGRYDGIGAVFGRARPATGFSADFSALAGLAAD